MVGLLLLGLGINKGVYGLNGNVMGDETVASASAVGTSGRLNGKKPDPKNFRLNPRDFQMNEGRVGGQTASGAGMRPFDTRAFGLGVLRMQQDFKDTLEASREAAKQEFQDHKTEFQHELSLIKDTKKQSVVDKINTDCQTVNQKRTDAMTAMLEKLSTILTNVSNRSASTAASGKDTTTVETAISTAQNAVADAQSAVAAQAGANCTITIASDTTVKSDVGKGISALQQALQTVYQKVLSARKAVSDAIHALAQVTGESLTATKPEPPSASAVAGGQQ